MGRSIKRKFVVSRPPLGSTSSVSMSLARSPSLITEPHARIPLQAPSPLPWRLSLPPKKPKRSQKRKKRAGSPLPLFDQKILVVEAGDDDQEEGQASPTIHGGDFGGEDQGGSTSSGEVQQQARVAAAFTTEALLATQAVTRVS